MMKSNRITKITRVIVELAFSYWKAEAKRPWDINCGNCDSFAEEVTKLIPRARMEWAPPPYAHCFIVYRNKAYDAECPQGTVSWRYLPCILREYVLTRAKSERTLE